MFESFKNLLVRILFKPLFLLAGSKPLRVGRCEFHGPPEFVNDCGIAMEKFRELDPNLYDRFVRQKFLFWYVPYRLEQTPATLASTIGEYYRTYGTDGIIARCVSTYFCAEVFERRHKLGLSQKDGHLEYWKSSYRWLFEHKFPEDIVDLFEVTDEAEKE